MQNYSFKKPKASLWLLTGNTVKCFVRDGLSKIVDIKINPCYKPNCDKPSPRLQKKILLKQNYEISNENFLDETKT